MHLFTTVNMIHQKRGNIGVDSDFRAPLYILNINPKKSTGPDGISPRLLKLAGNAIIPSLIDLFIWSAQVEEMFESWKLARLTPIFKKDVEEDKENYRPFSLLCVPSKILEEEVNNTIVKHVFE